MKERYPTRPLGAVLDGFLKKAGLDGALSHRGAWANAAGPMIAAHVVSTGIRGWTLQVEAESPHWLEQVEILEAQLIPRLQAEGLEVTRLSVRLSEQAAGRVEKKHRPRK